MGFVNFNSENNINTKSFNKTSDGLDLLLTSGTWRGVKSSQPVDLSSYKKMWIKLLCLADARESDTSLCFQAFIYNTNPTWNATTLTSIYSTLTDIHSKNQVMCFESDFNGGSSYSTSYVSIAAFGYGGKYFVESIWFSK